MPRIIYTLHAAWIAIGQDGPGGYSPELPGTQTLVFNVRGSRKIIIASLQVSGQRHTALQHSWCSFRKIKTLGQHA
jgi:hypothetical protein